MQDKYNLNTNPNEGIVDESAMPMDDPHGLQGKLSSQTQGNVSRPFQNILKIAMPNFKFKFSSFSPSRASNDRL